LRHSLRTAALDALIVTSLPNIAYPIGLFASTAAVPISDDELTLIVDARYLGPATGRQSELEGLSLSVEMSGGSVDESIADAAGRCSRGTVGWRAAT